MTTNRISYIVFIKESDMRCLQSFCYIFCGSKFLPTCRADDYSEFSRNLATVWRRVRIIRVGQRREIIRETVQDVCRNNPDCCIICFNLVIAKCSQICASMGEAACLQIRIRLSSSIILSQRIWTVYRLLQVGRLTSYAVTL